MEAMTAGTATRCEDLTPLGVHLSTLPIDARLGKLILLGTIFGVTDESLIISAALSTRSPFLSPHEERQKGEENRKRWAKKAGVSSDHIAVLAAYVAWDSMQGSSEEKFAFCRQNLLGAKTLQMCRAHRVRRAKSCKSSSCSWFSIRSSAGNSNDGLPSGIKLPNWAQVWEHTADSSGA